MHLRPLAALRRWRQCQIATCVSRIGPGYPRSLHIVTVTLESPPQCSERRHVRLHLLRGVSLRSNRGDLRVRGRILGQEKLGGV